MIRASSHQNTSAAAKTMPTPRRVSATAAARRTSRDETSPNGRTAARLAQDAEAGPGILASVPPASPQISVVIPCLDEEEAVGAVVDQAWEGIQRSGRDGEVIVVDNDSNDRSAEVAAEHGARVVRESQRGY